jgi:hypothetical protein
MYVVCPPEDGVQSLGVGQLSIQKMFRVLETHCAVNSTGPNVETGVVGKLAAETFELFEVHPVNVQPVTDGFDEGAVISKPSM